MTDWIADLERLSALRGAGHMTNQQFEDAKARVMAGMGAASPSPPAGLPEPTGFEVIARSKPQAVSEPVPQESTWDLEPEQVIQEYGDDFSRPPLWPKVLAGIGLLGAFGGAAWLLAPSKNPPEALAGKIWALDCKGVGVEWIRGFEVSGIPGKGQSGSWAATYYWRPGGVLVDTPGGDFRYDLSSGAPRLVSMAFAGISVGEANDKPHVECSGTFGPPEDPDSGDISEAELGLGIALTSKDKEAVPKLISKMGGLRRAKRPDNIRIWANLSSPELRALILREFGEEPVATPEQRFADGLKPWVPINSFPRWMEGSFSGTCSFGTMRFQGTTRYQTSSIGSGLSKSVTYNSIAQSGDRVMTNENGFRVFYERGDGGSLILLGTVIASDAATPGSTRSVLHRCDSGNMDASTPFRESYPGEARDAAQAMTSASRGHIIVGSWAPEGEYCASGAGWNFKPGGAYTTEGESGEWTFENDVLDMIIPAVPGATGAGRIGKVTWRNANEISVRWESGGTDRLRRCPGDNSMREPWYPNG